MPGFSDYLLPRFKFSFSHYEVRVQFSDYSLMTVIFTNVYTYQI